MWCAEFVVEGGEEKEEGGGGEERRRRREGEEKRKRGEEIEFKWVFLRCLHDGAPLVQPITQHL